MDGPFTAPNALGGRGQSIDRFNSPYLQNADYLGIFNPYANQLGSLGMSTICTGLASPYPAQPYKKTYPRAIKFMQTLPYLGWLDKLLHRPP